MRFLHAAVRGRNRRLFYCCRASQRVTFPQEGEGKESRAPGSRITLRPGSPQNALNGRSPSRGPRLLAGLGWGGCRMPWQKAAWQHADGSPTPRSFPSGVAWASGTCCLKHACTHAHAWCPIQLPVGALSPSPYVHTELQGGRRACPQTGLPAPQDQGSQTAPLDSPSSPNQGSGLPSGHTAAEKWCDHIAGQESTCQGSHPVQTLLGPVSSL